MIINKQERRMSQQLYLFAITILLATTIIDVAFAATNNTVCFKHVEESARGSRAVDTLKFVVVVSRHGNRAGFATFPNDPYPKTNTTFWPYGSHNDISPVGRVQLFNLGAKIRSLYNGFLDSIYSPKEFFASSTIMERTLTSGRAFLEGLFPITGHQKWSHLIPSQLVPLYSTSPDKAMVLQDCVAMTNLREASMKKSSDENAIKMNSVLAHITKNAGFNATNYIDFNVVWDSFAGADHEGYILPDWTKAIYPDPMTELYKKQTVAYNADSLPMVRLISGLLSKEIVENMKSKLNGTLTKGQKMFYYSSHDLTILSLQYIFGVDKPSMAAYIKPGSALILELHENPDTNDTFLEILFIEGGSSDLTPTPLVTSGCGTPCRFNQLLNFTQQFTNITDLHAECNNI